MEHKINIAELLKDCPKGMELDCLMFEGLEFDSIVDNEFLPIRCRIKNPNGGYNGYNFTKYGCWADTTFAKCVIFPKGKTTWEGFHRPFKDGDVVVTTLGSITIISNKINNKIYITYCGLFGKDTFAVDKVNVCPERHATEEEKQKLFQAIKDNGYKWNAEIKTLEKLPKAKFDITTLKPFDKVLVRVCDTAKWIGDFYMWYDDTEKDFPYNCVGGIWSQCIPYEVHKELLGTTNNPEGYGSR